MPNIGDTCRGDHLGRKKYQWYIWSACTSCNQGRWAVMERKNDGVASSAICYLCISQSAKRNEKISSTLKLLKAERSANWRGWRYEDKRGYVLVYLDENDFYYPMIVKGRYTYEHRLIMAKSLGRNLTQDELVHHKNGVRNDNRLINLALLTKHHHPHNTFVSILQERIKELEDKTRPA